MAVRDITTRLKVVDDLSGAFRKAGQEADKLASSVEKAGTRMDEAAKPRPGIGKDAAAGVARWKDLGDAAEKAGAKTGPAIDKANTSVGRLTASLGKVKAAASSGLDGMAASAQKGADAAEKASDKYEALGKAGQKAAVAGAALAVGVGGLVKKYSDFETAMSGVSAATMGTAAEMDQLREAAVKLGGDTQYSAKEAADGITEMAKAGVSTADILGGGLAGALSLAAAGQMEVAAAAETASAAMVQFKLSGDQLPHVADLLAAGAGKAMGSVHDLGMALNQTGLVASSTGLSIEETVGGLSAFASAGLIGSDAGTSFKTMLQRLTPQSEKAATAMDDLGISAYDQNGKFIGLSAVAGQLQDSMGNLSAEQRQATMQTIFGADAIRAATVLYENGAAGIDEWIGKVNDQGYAAEQAARLTDNLAGDWERLGGAFDSVVMGSGGSLNGMLRDITQGAEGLVDTVGSLPQPVLESATVLAAMGAATLTVGGGMVALIPKIAATRAAITAFTASNTAAAASMGLLGGAAAVAATGLAADALHTWTGSATVADVETSKLADSLTKLGAGGEAPAFMDLLAVKGLFATNSVESTAEAVDSFGQTAARATAPTNILLDGLTGKGEQVGRFGEQIQQIDAALAQMVTSGNPQAAKAAVDQLMASVSKQGGNVDEVRAKLTLYTAALAGNTGEHAKAKAAADKTAAAAAGLTVEEYKLKAGLEEAKAASDGFKQSIAALGAELLGQRDAARGFEAAIDAANEAVKSNGRTLDIHTEKGRNNQAALDALATSGTKAASEILKAGGSVRDAAAQVDKTRASFITAATKMGMTGVAANKLADELGLTKTGVVRLAQSFGQLPSEVRTRIIVDGLSDAMTSVRGLMSGLQKLDRTSATAVVRIASQGMNPWAAFNSHGSLVEAYAAGGVREQHTAQMAKAGAWRVWAEPETGGESYIPHANDGRRGRALDIWRETGQIIGAPEVAAFAGGGVVRGGGPGKMLLGAAVKSGGTVFDMTANVVKVIPPKDPVPVDLKWAFSDQDRALLRGPELVSMLTGVDLPDVDPVVKQVRDSYAKLFGVLDGQVRDQADLAGKVTSASEAFVKAQADYNAAVSGAAAKRAESAAKGAASAGKASAAALKGKLQGALGSAAAKPYLGQILAMGAKYGVAPELIAAVIKQESGFNPNAKSPVGARGLMQLMPGTFKGLGVAGKITTANTNIEAGTKYLAQQIKTFGGDVTKVLAAYNAGPGAARSGKWKGYKETTGYVKKITGDAGVKSLGGTGGYSSSKVAGFTSSQTAAAGNAIVQANKAGVNAVKKVVAAKTSPDDARALAVANALGMVGKGSYKWGGGHSTTYYKNSAALAADCSGFVGWAIGRAAGKNKTSTAAGMLRGNKSLGYVKIDPKIAAKTAGAIMGNTGHVVMSMGDGTVVDSYSKGKPVRRRALRASDYKMAAWNTSLGAMTQGTAAQVGGGGAGGLGRGGGAGGLGRGGGAGGLGRGPTPEAIAKKALDDAKKALDAAKLEEELNRKRAAAVDGLKKQLVDALPQAEAMAQAYAYAKDQAAQYADELDRTRDAQASFSKSVAGSISELGNLVTAMSSDTSINGSIGGLGAVLGARELAVKQARSFKASIDELKALGLNSADLGDLIGAGADKGGEFAERLAKEGRAGVEALNASRAELDGLAVNIGTDFADHMYGDQVRAAEEIAKAWADNRDKLADAAWKVGESMQAAILKGLGLTDGTLGQKTSTLLEQMKQQWLAGLGIAYQGKPATVVAKAPGVASSSVLSAPQVTVQPTFQQHVYIGDREITDIVRVETTEVLNGVAQQARVQAGGGWA